MIKTLPQILLSLCMLIATQVQAQQCDYTPDKTGFDFSFTAYGAPDKSYIVSGNRFTDYQLASASGKLLDASIVINAKSLDTSHDLSNGMGGEWPDSIPPVRNSNVVNNLFMNFANPGQIEAKISKIGAETLDLTVMMNGESRVVPMQYSVVEGELKATGTLDILDFNASDAFKKFEAVCTGTWHKGKSWSTVDISFSVPVEETACR